jgi:tRNA threonylcarbamoyladenosine biosynthesis protein TsaB
MPADGNRMILALDAAGSACSAALWRDGALAHSCFEEMDYGHAQALMPMVEEVVGPEGYGALDLICVGTGPGAYTGLRIAISAARGLALATGIQALGIENFAMHALAARRQGAQGPLAVILETRRAEFYVRRFEADDAPAGAADVLDAATLSARLAMQPAFLAGDAVARFMTEVPDAPGVSGTHAGHADAAILAEIAARMPAVPDAPPPSPVYLRPPDTTPPRADRQRLR